MITTIAPSQCPWELLLLADPSRDLVESYLSDAVTLASFDVDTIQGVVVMTPISSDSWEIKNIAVREDLHGRGIGKDLLKAALLECQTRGARHVWIGTGNSSIAQLGLYQRVGFRMAAIDRDFFVRNYPDKIIENGIECRDMVRLVCSF